MIERSGHGWTTADNANADETLLWTESFPGNHYEAAEARERVTYH